MLIIFWDYDGTLVDTETIYRESLISFFKENNYNKKEITTDYFYKNIAGKHPEEFLTKLENDNYIEKNLNIDPIEIKKYYTYYFNNLEKGKIKITKNIDKLIDKLSKNKEIIMCITSSSYTHDFQIKANNLDNKIFNQVFNINKNVYLCGSIEGCNFKPSPDIYIHTFNDITKKYNLNTTKNDNLLIIEDSIAGCKAGSQFKKLLNNKINIQVIGYLGASVLDNSQSLIENGADTTIKNIDDLEKKINKFTKIN